MVIDFPVDEASAARLAVARAAEQRSPSFGYLTLAMAASLMFWAGLAAVLWRL